MTEEGRVTGPDGFDDFVVEHGRGLLRLAWLLTGDWAAAEDLVQTTFTKTWKNWDRVSRADEPAAYVRRILVNTHLRWRRRRWTGEQPYAEVPEQADRDEIGTVELRQSLRTALGTLPPRQRAVVALRYFADLSEIQTAAALGCSTGTVKSQASRALATLRSNPALADLLAVEVKS
jgi:RNA polymerase sigma-70 factor (sigma-E family)